MDLLTDLPMERVKDGEPKEMKLASSLLYLLYFTLPFLPQIHDPNTTLISAQGYKDKFEHRLQPPGVI